MSNDFANSIENEREKKFGVHLCFPFVLLFFAEERMTLTSNVRVSVVLVLPRETH